MDLQRLPNRRLRSLTPVMSVLAIFAVNENYENHRAPMRIDLHIVRELHHWHLQSARGKSLAVFQDADAALVAARERQWMRRTVG